MGASSRRILSSASQRLTVIPKMVSTAFLMELTCSLPGAMFVEGVNLLKVKNAGPFLESRFRKLQPRF